MGANPNFCDHLLYLAEIEYEGHHPVYESEFFKNEQRVIGNDQVEFSFCPLCGQRLNDLPEDS